MKRKQGRGKPRGSASGWGEAPVKAAAGLAGDRKSLSKLCRAPAGAEGNGTAAHSGGFFDWGACGGERVQITYGRTVQAWFPRRAITTVVKPALIKPPGSPRSGITARS